MYDGSLKEVPGGDCANPGLSIFFMTSYILISNLIIINMYIAIILENFNQAHEQEEIGITEDDFEMFYMVWEKYDPHATQFIKNEHLSDLVADVEEPLGIPKPNDIALVALELPIMEGNRVHCLDILTALVKHVLGDVNEDSEEFHEAKKQMNALFEKNFPTKQTQVVISTTLTKKKEDVAARTLQVCLFSLVYKLASKKEKRKLKSNHPCTLNGRIFSNTYTKKWKMKLAVFNLDN